MTLLSEHDSDNLLLLCWVAEGSMLAMATAAHNHRALLIALSAENLLVIIAHPLGDGEERMVHRRALSPHNQRPLFSAVGLLPPRGAIELDLEAKVHSIARLMKVVEIGDRDALVVGSDASSGAGMR